MNYWNSERVAVTVFLSSRMSHLVLQWAQIGLVLTVLNNDKSVHDKVELNLKYFFLLLLTYNFSLLCKNDRRNSKVSDLVQVEKVFLWIGHKYLISTIYIHKISILIHGQVSRKDGTVNCNCTTNQIAQFQILENRNNFILVAFKKLGPVGMKIKPYKPLLTSLN